MLTDPVLNSTFDVWAPPALASCQTLKWIGVYLCFAFVCGIGLNGFLLCFVFQNKRHGSPIDVFIIALCLADLLAALLGIPLPLTSNLACRWLYGKYLCYYEGFIAYFVGMIGLYLLTALSMNRYWMIVTPKKEQYVTYQTAYISVLLSILGGLFWAVPPVFGWNDYKLEGVQTSCSICWQDRTLNVMSYNILMFIFAYLVPLIVMIYCNICIYLKVRYIVKRRLTWKKSFTVSRVNQKKQNMEQRMAKTVFLIITTFVIAWTPYAIVAFISAFFSPTLISPLVGTIPAIFAKSSVYFNPLVYIVSNSSVRSKLPFFRGMDNKPSENSDSLKDKCEQSASPRLLRTGHTTRSK